LFEITGYFQYFPFQWRLLFLPLDFLLEIMSQ
jgi:hypothetical protein